MNLRRTGAAITGAAAGAGAATGTGYCLRDTAGGSTETGEGAHLTPGGLLAAGAIGRFPGLI